ncbi:MAG: DUF1311 domain-containing protein [Hydrogenophilaceae bacterium]|jgi:uncharacterized protein YecT (DUF1311 family)|nr:DUF1311 domain-containing protein [Hydrogenophilaceae bacterium]
MRIAALAFLIGLAAACAHADPFESFEALRMLSCVASAEAAGGAVAACLGAGARPCIAAEGPATMSETLCWSHEADWWIAQAQDAEARLRARDPPRAPALSGASEAFARFAESECAYRGETFQGGSGAQPAAARCLAELWSARAVMLLATERRY